MYGPRQRSRTLLRTKCQIFLEAVFICNNINTNITKISIHSYHFFKPLFSFFHISVRSSLKRFENEIGPWQGTFLIALIWAF